MGESQVAPSTPCDQSASVGRQAEGAPENTDATSEIREAAVKGAMMRQINPYSCHGSSVISL